MASEISYLGKLVKLFKVAEESEKLSEVPKVAKTISQSLKLGALGGLTSFFGLEWISNGGIIRAGSGALGIPEIYTSILFICIIVGVLCFVFYLASKRYAHPVSRQYTKQSFSNKGGRYR